jgi:hypothetical protein
VGYKIGVDSKGDPDHDPDHHGRQGGGVSGVILVTQPVLSQELSVIDGAKRAGITPICRTF